MACSATLYQYKELEPGCIRLLQLLPGELDSPISCSISHVPFTSLDAQDSSPSSLSDDDTASGGDDSRSLLTPSRQLSYEALSYVWGPPQPMRYVAIDDGRVLPIRENLWHFLKRLRNAESSRTLWADAMCIDQSNNAEKSVQVGIMGLIFREARQVLLWLGEEADDSAFLMHLAATSGALRTSRSISRQLGSMQVIVAAEQFRTWEALEALFYRLYWGRTWIVQEIVLARGKVIIFCGPDELDYDTLYGMYEVLRTCRRYNFSVSTNKDGLRDAREERLKDIAFGVLGYQMPFRRLYSRRNEEYTLPSLLDRYWVTQCEDVRDKVFALLSMAYDVPDSLRQSWINYSKSVLEVFFDVVTFYIAKDNGTLLDRTMSLGWRLMLSMNIDLQSFRQYFNSLKVQGESPWASGLLSTRLKFGLEYVIDLNQTDGSEPDVVSSSSIIRNYSNSTNTALCLFGNYHHYPETYLRGITYNIQPNDEVYRFSPSDIALVLRPDPSPDSSFAPTFAPVAWALLGYGEQWEPDEENLETLEHLRQQPLPSKSEVQRKPGFRQSASVLLSMPVVVVIMARSGIMAHWRRRRTHHLDAPEVAPPKEDRRCTRWMAGFGNWFWNSFWWRWYVLLRIERSQKQQRMLLAKKRHEQIERPSLRTRTHGLFRTVVRFVTGMGAGEGRIRLEESGETGQQVGTSSTPP